MSRSLLVHNYCADRVTVCCCPPNLSRTLGMLGGYTWRAAVKETERVIKLDVYLFVSGSRKIDLPNGQTAEVTMRTEMPWKEKTEWEVKAPEGWRWEVQLPVPNYAANVKVGRKETVTNLAKLYSQLSTDFTRPVDGYTTVTTPANSSFSMTFDMPVRLLSPHPDTLQDTLTVSRGPIIYVAEGVDNESLERKYTHFEHVGLEQSATFDEEEIEIRGIPMVGVTSRPGALFALEAPKEAYSVVSGRKPARAWRPLEGSLTLVPWFARANRGGSGHVRTSFARADKSAVYMNGNGH